MEPTNPELVVRHEEIYRGIIVTLHLDTIRLASGATAIREVVLHPGGVVALPVFDDGRVALIRQFRYPLGRYILELPAGKLDSGQSPIDTIARELEEETGYRAARIKHEFSFYTTPGISNEMVHFFVAQGLTHIAQNLEEGEHITVEIYSLTECLEKIRNGEITDGKTIIGLLWHGMNFR